MSSREKNQSDFDLETFVDLFDTAISSNNPAVQKALKNLLLITTMVQSELSPEERIKGPLRQIIDDIKNLNRRLGRLEDQNVYPQTPSTPFTNPNIIGPNINPIVPPNWPPNTITCSNGTGAKPSVNALKSEDC
jgi:hypothetical protein